MNTKESLPHALGRKALDAIIPREYDGWPPKILLPVASCMQRAFF